MEADNWDEHTRNKRSRSENWSEEDKELLKQLVRMRVKDIENKHTDTNTNHRKKRAWMDLEKEFNSKCSCVKRTVQQLKSQWTTIKIQAKKEASECGMKPLNNESLFSNDIGSWLSSSQYAEGDNEYDSEAALTKLTEPTNENPCLEVEIHSDVEKEEEEKKMNEEPKPDPDVYKKIRRPKKRKFPTDKSKVADNNIAKIAANDIECRKELHQMQIEAERKKIRNLDLEYEVLQAKLDFYKDRRKHSFMKTFFNFETHTKP
ncbi:uncharacterized protein LOC142227022 [Haematobia irritans]|uniref:uncharacterized protein LOC142227022 n=1 Tax=Haematobia irritans TaxID=7368 RepID=UPI003F4F577A